MSFTLREIKISDLDLLQSWWEKSQGYKIPIGNLPETTYFACKKEVPLVSVSLITNNIETAQLENFIGNPELKGALRREATLFLLSGVKRIAKIKGYKRLFCMAHEERLHLYYRELGFCDTLTGITTMTMEL